MSCVITHAWLPTLTWQPLQVHLGQSKGRVLLRRARKGCVGMQQVWGTGSMCERRARAAVIKTSPYLPVQSRCMIPSLCFCLPGGAKYYTLVTIKYCTRRPEHQFLPIQNTWEKKCYAHLRAHQVFWILFQELGFFLIYVFIFMCIFICISIYMCICTDATILYFQPPFISTSHWRTKLGCCCGHGSLHMAKILLQQSQGKLVSILHPHGPLAMAEGKLSYMSPKCHLPLWLVSGRKLISR